ncbi:hypothetical protein BSL82_17040 [Tardibacter chloracetimidivorans]|uniref:Uncharacterized protein n=1 Tax=Tardibacter chloracetimidivorans TaxID=1921510 RepID=A0A1L3ZYT8_9SPHN|nr:hypothetical protein [Tardibacter chloracetimidivorans]API60775.1 hypothetical protein BSL82_17040 [Tardibacter chloracetimidivorans]
MRHMPRTLLSAATAALLATSVASPADARRYRHHDRGVDLGDLIVGAVIIGGIAVLASEMGKARDKDGTIFGGDRNRGGDTESAAVSACTDAAEIRASQSGRIGRVSDIGDVETDGDRVRVRGTVEYGGSGGWGDRNDRDDWRDRVRFTCTYSDGRVDGVWLEDGYAWR